MTNVPVNDSFLMMAYERKINGYVESNIFGNLTFLRKVLVSKIHRLSFSLSSGDVDFYIRRLRHTYVTLIICCVVLAHKFNMPYWWRETCGIKYIAEALNMTYANLRCSMVLQLVLTHFVMQSLPINLHL